MEYLVLECHPAYAVLLDGEGRFVRAANLGYEAGQRVTNPVLMEEEQKAEKKAAPARMLRRAVGALAACLCLLFLIGGLFIKNVHAKVELHLGPAAALEVDKEGTVVSLLPANKEGEALLQGYEGEGKSAETVCHELMERAQALNFAPPAQGYSLTVSSSKAGWVQRLESRLWQEMAAYGDTTILVLPVP